MRSLGWAFVALLLMLSSACEFGVLSLQSAPIEIQLEVTTQIEPPVHDAGEPGPTPPPPQDEGEQPPDHCAPDSGRPYVHLCH